MLRPRRFAIWIALTLILTTVMLQLPLFGVLGYELALAFALFGSLAGLDLGGAVARAAQERIAREECSPWRVVAALTGVAVLMPLGLLVVPLVGAAIHGLWVPTCDWWFGLKAFLWMPVMSTTLGAATGVAITLWLGRVRYLTALAPWLIALALLAAAMVRFYGQPAVFSYSPLVGFFPGNLYDEDIRLGAPLYWSRLEQFATVMALLAGAIALRVRGWRPLKPGPLSLALVALLAVGVLRGHAAALGYRIDADDIQDELGGVYRTPHFVIHYARPALDDDIELYAVDHELRLAQVCRLLGVNPASVGTIRSYVFADPDQKARLMGARRVEMAKPWRKEIYLTHEEFPHGALRHEIAHVVAGTFGSSWFHVSAQRRLGLPLLFNPGLIEGLAVAVDWPGGSRTMTPHQAMRAMEELGFAPALGDVLSVRFLTLSSARSYTAAGSFLRFLLESRGAAAVRALYRSGGDFQAAFGTSEAALVAAWGAMLSTIGVPPEIREAARDRFRQPGVFARPCPHANAVRVARAHELRAHRQDHAAIQLLRQVCRDAPDEPSFRFTLAGVLAMGESGERTEAREIYETFAQSQFGAAIVSEALSGLVALDAAANQMDDVRRHVDAALALPLDDDRRRPFEAMRFALDATGLGGVALRAYFFSQHDAHDGLRWAMLAALTGDRAAAAMGWYLAGIQLSERGEHAASAWAMSTGLSLGVASPRFVRAGARRLVVSAWRSGQRDRLDQAIELLAASNYDVDRLLADDWRERAAFTSRGVTSR